MLALTAVLVLAPLLYLPGLALHRALLGATQPADALERTYERVVLGALLNGWLAFTLAETGIFTLWLHLLLLALVCAAAMVRGQRSEVRGQRIRNWRLETGDQSQNLKPQNSKLKTHVAFAAIGLIFLVLVARPFEVVLGVRDAGVYANTGFAIARTGGIVQHDALVAQIAQDEQARDKSLADAAAQAERNLLGAQNKERWNATRLRAAGFYIVEGDLASGRVIPQNFHLFPVWIGLLSSLLGREGGLLATGLMGALGVWSVGMLGRRLAGAWVGGLAMLLLALNGVQVWFSRYAMTETTAQFLTFAGLYGFAKMSDWRLEISDSGIRTPQSQVAGRQSPQTVAALVAGLAFGQLALTRIDFVLVVGPVLAYLFYIWLTRRWTRLNTVFGAALVVLLLHATIHIMTIARAYFFDTLYSRLQDYAITSLIALPFLTPTLQTLYLSRKGSAIGIRLGPGLYRWNVARIAAEIAVVIIAVAAVFALRRWGQPLLAWVERGVRRYAVWLLRLAALGIVLAAVYGYIVRPQIISGATLAGLPQCLAARQWTSGACLRLQGYVGAPIALPGAQREVYEIPLANMVRVGWYLSPLGIVLGVAGFALWWRRGLNGASWLFLAIGLLASAFFIRQSYGTSDQTYIYILRRFVPHVYPTFCLGIAYALVALAHKAQGTRHKASGFRLPFFTFYLLPFTFAAALVAFLLLTNRVLYQHVEYGGALAQLGAAAQQFAPDDVLLLRGGAPTFGDARDLPDNIATPLKYTFGLNALTIKSKEPGNYADELARYIQRWQAQGRNVYLLLGASGAVGLPGVQLTPTGGAVTLRLREFEQLVRQKPSNVQDFSLDYRVYRVTPAPAPAQPASVGIDDYAAQVRGFYHPEQIKGVNLAWTNGDALLRLAWPRANAPLTLTVQLAGGQRPAKLGAARVCLALAPERDFWVENPKAPPPFGAETCYDLAPELRGYTFTLDPRATPAPPTGTFLLHIRSAAWTPAQADPTQNDGRGLGVQFGGLAVTR